MDADLSGLTRINRVGEVVQIRTQARFPSHQDRGQGPDRSRGRPGADAGAGGTRVGCQEIKPRL